MRERRRAGSAGAQAGRARLTPGCGSVHSEPGERVGEPAGHLQPAGRVREVKHLLVVPQLQPVKARQFKVSGEQIVAGELVRQLRVFSLVVLDDPRGRAPELLLAEFPVLHQQGTEEAEDAVEHIRKDGQHLFAVRDINLDPRYLLGQVQPAPHHHDFLGDVLHHRTDGHTVIQHQDYILAMRQGDHARRPEAQPLVEHMDLGVPGVRFHHHAFNAWLFEQPLQHGVHHRGRVPRLGISRRRRHQQVHADVAVLHGIDRGQRRGCWQVFLHQEDGDAVVVDPQQGVVMPRCLDFRVFLHNPVNCGGQHLPERRIRLGHPAVEEGCVGNGVNTAEREAHADTSTVWVGAGSALSPAGPETEPETGPAAVGTLSGAPNCWNAMLCSTG